MLGWENSAYVEGWLITVLRQARTDLEYLQRALNNPRMLAMFDPSKAAEFSIARTRVELSLKGVTEAIDQYDLTQQARDATNDAKRRFAIGRRDTAQELMHANKRLEIPQAELPEFLRNATIDDLPKVTP